MYYARRDGGSTISIINVGMVGTISHVHSLSILIWLIYNLAYIIARI